jgi:hypothetical protein
VTDGRVIPPPGAKADPRWVRHGGRWFENHPILDDWLDDHPILKDTASATGLVVLGVLIVAGVVGFLLLDAYTEGK